MSDIGAIESLLFVSGDEGLTLEEMAQLTKSSLDHAAACLDSLKEKYKSDESGIFLIETANKYKLATKRAYSETIKLYAQSPLMNKLTRAVLETLSIVAYKQPVTRMEIEEIRGVSVSNALQKLKLRDLVKEVDRLDAPGKPVLYGTTAYFLDYFGLNDLTEMPELELDEKFEETNLFSNIQQESFERDA